jgi:hypothetical protein
MSEEPRRLAEDPTAPQALREDLARARGIAPAPLDVEGGVQRLRAGIAAGSAGAGGAGVAAGKTGLLAGLGWGIVAVGALVGTTVLVANHRDRGALTARAGSVEAPAASVARPASASERLAASEAAALPAAGDREVTTQAPPRPPSIVRARPRTAVPQAAAPAVAAEAPPPLQPALRAEVAQLIQARRFLETDPAAALALVEEGQRRFGDGTLGQEREAIAVSALAKLGRREEASRRGQDFVGRHPGGPFTARILELLAEISHARP